jgi:hypothetical protein
MCLVNHPQSCFSCGSSIMLGYVFPAGDYAVYKCKGCGEEFKVFPGNYYTAVNAGEKPSLHNTEIVSMQEVQICKPFVNLDLYRTDPNTGKYVKQG